VALAEDGKTLITGSKDTTLMLWKIQTVKNNTRVDEAPVHILYGHDDEVTTTISSLLTIY
jgi:WD40 repeat protein